MMCCDDSTCSHSCCILANLLYYFDVFENSIVWFWWARVTLQVFGCRSPAASRFELHNERCSSVYLGCSLWPWGNCCCNLVLYKQKWMEYCFFFFELWLPSNQLASSLAILLWALASTRHFHLENRQIFCIFWNILRYSNQPVWNHLCRIQSHLKPLYSSFFEL